MLRRMQQTVSGLGFVRKYKRLIEGPGPPERYSRSGGKAANETRDYIGLRFFAMNEVLRTTGWVVGCFVMIAVL